MIERRGSSIELSVMTMLVAIDSGGAFQYVRSRYDANAVSALRQRTPREMIGRTVKHVHVFLNKFTTHGFIEYHGELEMHSALLSVILQE
jgi:predicted metalloprotease